LYYNKDHFDAAGLEYPTDEWTWDDLRAAAEALTVKEASGRVSRYGLAMEGGKYFDWVGANGGLILDDMFNPTQCMLSQPEAVEGIEFFAGMMNDEIAWRDANLNQAGGDLAVFTSEQASMFIQNASRVPALNAAGINYDVAAVPTAPGGGRSAGSTNGAAWVMSAVTDAPEASWDFLQFLQSPDGGQAIYFATGEAFPPTRSGAESPVSGSPNGRSLCSRTNWPSPETSKGVMTRSAVSSGRSSAENRNASSGTIVLSRTKMASLLILSSALVLFRPMRR
jgi:multiple sugar transport system substrate-binding protein